MVAPTVIITGRIRSMPASGKARSRFTLMMHFLNEVEQHDDMAYDDSDKAGYSKKSHEAKRDTHNVQRDQRSHYAIRHGRKDQ